MFRHTSGKASKPEATGSFPAVYNLLFADYQLHFRNPANFRKTGSSIELQKVNQIQTSVTFLFLMQP